ncbi:glycosyl hydrolase family 28 protein [Mucilaginibacter sp. CSA2-8R]|uniref:glycoside hydrolase family 28 protein n=1 Tax=Mucilaginibacter sp. CSA2-8R TaxID=3141542 RepID=UPI00315CC12C
MKKIYSIVLLMCAHLAVHAQKNYTIANYGAKITLPDNASAIQKAIDDASANGGGRVIVPAGNFVTGPVKLKNNVELHLAEYAVLLGSTHRLDFAENSMAVISALGQHHVSVTGKGTITGQAHLLMADVFKQLRDGKIQDEQWLTKRPTEKNRPNLIFFKNCKDVKVTGINLKDAASWIQNYKECDGVVIDSISVNSTAYWNNDGIDIVDSKNVRISNSFFNASDDAICLKSEIADGYCENVVVENCTLRSSANGFKLGTGSVGGFKNIKVRNITVYDTYRSAIALEAVDGGFIENIDIRNVRAKNTGNAFFIRLGRRNTDNRYSSIKDVLIDDVKVQIPAGKPDIGYPFEGPLPKVPPHNVLPASIAGLPGHLVQNVNLQNIEITYAGGASKEKAYVSIDSLNSVTENAAGYPEFNMFGELPAWGLYIRHAQGIQLKRFIVNVDHADFRPAMIFDDVTGLALHGVSIPAGNQLPAVVYKGVSKLSTVALTMPVAAGAIKLQK